MTKQKFLTILAAMICCFTFTTKNAYAQSLILDVGTIPIDSFTFSTNHVPRLTLSGTDTIYAYADAVLWRSVGIGTNKMSGFALSVNGYVRAREVVVNMDTWSDFVFEKGYKLITLDALEKEIKAHKHLPGIPSADEVCERGVPVGEMNKKLLQKVEELTLYIIDLNKRIDALEKTKEDKQ